MSMNQPPSGPPPSGPPPSGPPPSGTPAYGSPELLEQGGGGPIPPTPPPSRGAGGRGRRGLVVGGVIGALAVGGAAFGAYSWLSGTGDQPAEALPATTLGYLSVDLDPSGAQKIEALRTLRKFPAFKEQTGLDADDDLRQKIVEEALKDAPCDDLDYDDDFAPWLGDRFALAAVSQEGEEDPAPVFVVQVQDADKADTALEAIRDCAAADSEESGDSEDTDESGGDGGWAIVGDWAVIAESDELAEQITDDAEQDSLADDGDFQRWTDAAGDPGIISGYAAPEAGEVLAGQFAGLTPLLGEGLDAEAEPGLGSQDCYEIDPVEDLEAFQSCLEDDLGESSLEPESPVDPEAVSSMFEDFEGAGMNIRFDDGALEVELAVDNTFSGMSSLTASDRGGDVIATLPEETAVALGLGFESGWLQDVLDYMQEISGDELDLDSALSDMEEATGLSLPEDVETLFGESAALAVGSDLDPEAIFNSDSGLDEVPVGLKIQGDAEAIQEVLDKFTELGLDPEGMDILGSDAEGDVVVIGPGSDYRAELLEDGGLGDSDTYQDVVREDDAASILFVNFDAGDGWLAGLVGEDPQVQENIEPLGGLGLTGWSDGDVGHSMLRITTD